MFSVTSFILALLLTSEGVLGQSMNCRDQSVNCLEPEELTGLAGGWTTVDGMELSHADQADLGDYVQTALDHCVRGVSPRRIRLQTIRTQNARCVVEAYKSFHQAPDVKVNCEALCPQADPVRCQEQIRSPGAHVPVAAGGYYGHDIDSMSRELRRMIGFLVDEAISRCGSSVDSRNPALLSVHSQVVAGMNYCVVFQVEDVVCTIDAHEPLVGTLEETDIRVNCKQSVN